MRQNLKPASFRHWRKRVSGRQSKHAKNKGAPMQILWFKRDLRLADHAPLMAAQRGNLCLYIVEPPCGTTRYEYKTLCLYVNP